MFLDAGKVKVEIKTGNNPKALLDNYNEQFNDGRWHQCILTISKNSLILNIDNKPMKTTRLLQMATGPHYIIGGNFFFNLIKNRLEKFLLYKYQLLISDINSILNIS